MKIIEEQYNRYGEPDYDTGYIQWGFDDLETQLRMAEKLLSIFSKSGGKAILDVACGIARYHHVWLKSGYEVTGIDISKTFIEYARNYNKDEEKAHYVVSDFNELDFDHQFDIAVCTDPVELTGVSVNRIYKALKPGGVFIYEMWNDNYIKYHNDLRHNDCRTWTYKDGIYHLIRHEYNRATCVSEHEEIIFDIPNDTMIHKTGLGAKNVNSHCSVQILEAAGFNNVRFVDYDGQPFSTENEQVKQFFMVGEK
ncbi:class I SAM-dependent methyltransferase [Paenibacillus puldeungensis]|uniref:Class I SAM-dependent methyltransferase n=1 Tax=Paenibacillus puldeungensis TaxID=696536 RepID=A0ABW3S004_9BACL